MEEVYEGKGYGKKFERKLKGGRIWMFVFYISVVGSGLLTQRIDTQDPIDCL